MGKTPLMSAPRDQHGRFRNLDPAAAKAGLGKALRWALTREPEGETPPPLPQRSYPADSVPPGSVRAILVGHSTLLFEFGSGLRILTDPIFSRRCFPVQWMGPERYHLPGIAFEQLPPLDAVLITHNHYDHLDRITIRRLLGRYGKDLPFVFPLGLRHWMKRLGVRNMCELDWEESCNPIEGIQVVSVPAQHWSRRGLFDTNKSLWCSYFIHDARTGRRIYFTGDSGYGSHYRDAAHYGPFDLCALPIGAYNPAYMMASSHQTPEEAVQAWLDLGGKGKFLATHHSTFRLTDEPPAEPAQRLRAEWERLCLPPGDLWLFQPGDWGVV